MSVQVLAALLIASAAAQSSGTETCTVPPSAKRISPAQISSLSRSPGSASLPKGEFETSAQYEERLATARSEIGGYRANDIVVLELPLGERMTYDADRQRLTLTNLGIDYSGLMPVRISGRTYHGMALEAILLADRAFVGTNAFGAKRTVTSSEVDLVTVAWPRERIRVSGLQMNNLSRPRVFTGYPPSAAQELRNSGRIRVIGQVINPVFGRERTLSVGATFSSPVERVNNFAALFMVPQDVCIVGADGQSVLDAWTIEQRQ